MPKPRCTASIGSSYHAQAHVPWLKLGSSMVARAHWIFLVLFRSFFIPVKFESITR
jgi:hypothetical protein